MCAGPHKRRKVRHADENAYKQHGVCSAIRTAKHDEPAVSSLDLLLFEQPAEQRGGRIGRPKENNHLARNNGSDHGSPMHTSSAPSSAGLSHISGHANVSSLEAVNDSPSPHKTSQCTICQPGALNAPSAPRTDVSLSPGQDHAGQTQADAPPDDNSADKQPASPVVGPAVHSTAVAAPKRHRLLAQLLQRRVKQTTDDPAERMHSVTTAQGAGAKGQPTKADNGQADTCSWQRDAHCPLPNVLRLTEQALALHAAQTSVGQHGHLQQQDGRADEVQGRASHVQLAADQYSGWSCAATDQSDVRTMGERV